MLNGLKTDTTTSSPTIQPIDQVAILLSTFNGEEFLRAQLDSLVTQSYSNWTIYASDDGSSDATLKILSEYQAQLGPFRLKILTGPRKGFAANFMSLLQNEHIQAEYFAFCDQDDIWEPARLETGVQWMRDVPPHLPALFCSRTRLVNAQGKPIGFSPLFKKQPCFRNALVQSIAGGNTMLLNKTSRQLLAQTRKIELVVSHDWWAYILVSAHNGILEYSDKALVNYRQHRKNLVGSNSSLRERLVRISKIFQGTFRDWNERNISELDNFRQSLPTQNKNALDLFAESRQAILPKRISLLLRSGVYRQSLSDAVGLLLAAILKRM
ncbi:MULTISPECIES: glycosyltransferase family 2 protein [unclassified Pseudomonas]|uniref:glycosyltransferase family 2 protein n=1 Tax=unclassified Pseudomonas TaxID=196821 RepID=UPI00244CD673|nr:MULTISPECIES: glycosyltransferase family 2 protein [unclassified Pseudomonas]MDG9925367.1 glycosyltransferase family 2 protein [Pseudomonas sp. GD04045]MDH0037293.1 glycosyltransferase family 2 protein [Pseudomonas sp. GD04019]